MTNEVIKKFPKPKKVDDKTPYPHACEVRNGVPVLVLRAKTAAAINSPSARRIADEAHKTVSQYADFGIEPVSGAYLVNPDGEPITQADGGKTKKPLYERQFRLNRGL